MSKFFRIEMLPAGFGDSLWIEYGEDDTVHRILIDGGLGDTHEHLCAKLEQLPENSRDIELLVCTHVDLDHISGLLRFLKNPPPGVKIGEVWFNGWKQIEPYYDTGTLGPLQGEDLSELIRLQDMRHNHAFGGKAVVTKEDGEPIPLDGGMQVTLLGPNSSRLGKLADVWDAHVRAAGLVPGVASSLTEEDIDEDLGLLGGELDVDLLAGSDYKPDTSEANGSSIAFLLEYAGKRALFTGDAYAEDVLAGLAAVTGMAEDSLEFSVDALKLSHHGGKKNTSSKLLKSITATHYLISTNGVRYKHPNPETVARILVHAPPGDTRNLHFNYRSDHNTVWDDELLKSKYSYETYFPNDGTDGLVIVLA